ncbi:MAG: motility protein A [Planctomycetota bacterium]
MDLNTFVGGVLAFLLVLGAMTIGPGGLAVFVHVPSLIIVLGGTTAVTMLAFPIPDLKPVVKVMLVAAVRKGASPTDEIDRIVEYANLARREGLLALEDKLPTIDDPFFAKGIQLVIDGFSAHTVRDIMELEAQCEESRHATGKKIVDQLGAFAPAFGMIGTLIGLVQMLQDLSDPNGIGLGMATALLTTLYGAMAANMLFLPLASKLEIVAKNNQQLRQLMVEGIVAIQSGEKPQLIKEKLGGFLSPSVRVLASAEA